MKLIDQPIKLAALFSPDGKMMPTVFEYGSRRYKVTLMRGAWETRSWNHGDIQHFRLQAVGPDGQERICEVAFVRDEMRWVLEKI